MTSGSCIKCDLVAGRISTPGGAIYEDRLWHLSHVGQPAIYLPGMLVLTAKRHVESLADLTDEEAHSLGAIQRRVCRAVRETLGPERTYCLCFGEGSPHVHFAIVPRSAAMPAGSGVRTMQELVLERKYECGEVEAAATAEAIRAALSSPVA